MFEFPAAIRVPLAEWIDTLVRWLLTNWGPFFDVVNGSILSVQTHIERLLTWLPWWAGHSPRRAPCTRGYSTTPWPTPT